MNSILEPLFKEFKYDDQYSLGTGDGIAKWNIYKESEKPLPNNKWNVLKNAISALQFLTDELRDENKNPIVLYIGVTTPRSIILLSILFPTIRIHVYATKDLNITDSRVVKENEYLTADQITDNIKITIYERLINDTDMEIWQKFNSYNVYGENDIFLISKFKNNIIRVNNKYKAFYEPESVNKNNDLLIEDMKIQEKYVFMINPYKALLKFQLPKVTDKSINEFTYFRGELRKLVYAENYSMETSLLISNVSSSYEWSVNRYEDMLFYYNKIQRFEKYENQFNKSDLPINLELGLTNNFDSNLLVSIIRRFLIKHKKSDDINSTLKTISYIVNYLSKKDANFLNVITTGDYIFSKEFRLDI